jgi:hypothetical protein
LINPRLVDYFGLTFTQDDVDFAIPHLREDISLYLDPFLLWASDNDLYQELHRHLTAFFSRLRQLVQTNHGAEALRQLLACEEPKELGLGYTAGGKRGSAVGPRLAENMLAVYQHVPLGRRKSISDGNEPTDQQAATFDMLSPMLDSFVREMREFAKKKPEGIVTAPKVKMINRLLEQIKGILAADPSAAYLDLLDEEALPQNSDAVLILGQFQAAMAQFHGKHFGWDGSSKRWFTHENPRGKYS